MYFNNAQQFATVTKNPHLTTLTKCTNNQRFLVSAPGVPQTPIIKLYNFRKVHDLD